MAEYTLGKAETKFFAIDHTIYTDSNIYMRYSWTERIGNAVDNVDGHGFYLYRDGIRIGGIAINSNYIHYPFMVPPYDDRPQFWKTILAYVRDNHAKGIIHLDEIPPRDTAVLISLGAEVKAAQKRMCRPTDLMAPRIPGDFRFDTPERRDLPEMASAVWQAHSSGYTSTVWGSPELSDVEQALQRRFNLFSQTHTWDCSVIARRKDTDAIAGVCIAGIYPDSPDHFSTIHQVSVLPDCRRQGIAEAMMRHCIGILYSVSPVVCLGVLVGNPAESLYRKLGFAAGPEYCSLIYRV